MSGDGKLAKIYYIDMLICTIIIFNGCTKVDKPVQTQPHKKESVTTIRSDKRDVKFEIVKPDPRIITTIDADQVASLIKDMDLSVFTGALNIRSSFVEYYGWIYYYISYGKKYKVRIDGTENQEVK